MKISCRCSLLFFFFFISSSFGINDKSLGELVEKLSSVARITNWVAIQTNCIGDQARILDVAAELIGVHSGSELTDLSNIDVSGMENDLTQLQNIQRGIGAVSIGGTTMTSLKTLQGSASQCLQANSAGISKSSQAFQRKLKDAPNASIKFMFLDPSPFGAMKKSLEFIQSKPDMGNTKMPQKVLGELLELQEGVDNITASIGGLVDYQNRLSSLLALKGASQPISDIMVVVEVLRGSNNFGKLPAEFAILKTSVSSLIPATQAIQPMGTVAQKLDKLQLILQALSSSPADQSLTSGLPNKEEDVDRILKDLQDPWVRKSLAENKEFGKLEAMVKPVTGFSKEIKSLKNSLVSILSTTSNSTKLQNLLAGASVEGSKLRGVQNLDVSIQTVHACVKQLQPLKTLLNYDEMQKVYNRTRVIDEGVKNIEVGIQSVLDVAGIRTDNEVLASLGSILSDVTDSSNLAMVIAKMDSIRSIAGLQVFLDTLGEAKTRLETFSTYGIQKMTRGRLNWDEIDKVQTAFDESNLNVVLQCLESIGNTSSLDGIESLLKFGSNLKAIQKSDIDQAVSRLKEIPKIQGSLRAITTMTGQSKIPEAPQVVKDIGKGVQLLHKMRKVFEKRSTLSHAANYPDKVEMAISNITDAQKVWTKENKNAIKKLVTDVEGLNKAAEPMMSKGELEEMWKIFAAAEGVQGVAVNTSLFDDPIAKTLAGNSDVEVQNVAEELSDLSELDLDFTSARVELKTASLAFTSLRTMLDSFFQNTKKPTGGPSQIIQRVTVPTNGSPITLILCILLGLLIAVALIASIGYIAKRKYNNYKRKKRMIAEQEFRAAHREKYLMHSGLRRHIEGISPHTNLVLAVQTGVIAIVREILETSPYMDSIYEGRSALHQAIMLRDPEIVELLITSGANCGILNNENLMPRQYCAKLIADPNTTDSDKKKLEKIEAVFKKHENHNYEPKINDLLPVHLYTINVAEVKEHESLAEFCEMYKGIILEEESTKAITHYVLPVDADGIYDADKFNKMSEEELIAGFYPIFSASVVVCSSWMTACVKDKSNLHADYEHRVQKIRFCGRVYYTIDAWKKDLQRNRHLFLRGVNLMTMGAIDDSFKLIVELAGATVYDTLLGNDALKSPPPFYFPHLKPRFIVYGVKTEGLLKLWFKPPNTEKESDFTIMTSVEFYEFLLAKRETTDVSTYKKVDPKTEKTTEKTTESSIQQKKASK